MKTEDKLSDTVPEPLSNADTSTQDTLVEKGVTEQNEKRRASKSGQADPFEDEEGSAVKYKTMKWWQASMIMIAETISLGILSLPSVLATIGLVPGVVLIIGLGLIATYTGYTMWQFKMRYPHIVNMADAGEVMFGRIGREVFGGGMVILLVFSGASHILTFTIALNVITLHATCTIVFAIVAVVIFFIATLFRTLKKVSYLSIAAFISILSAVMITMIGLGIEQPDPVVSATVTGVSFANAFVAVTNIIFAYLGHVSFFTFMTELKDIRDFPKALFVLQAVDISLYVVVAVVCYRYAGAEVSSPALGSTSQTVSRIAYGVALPTIIVAAVIYIHVAAKYIYVRIFRGTKHMGSNTFLAVGSWVAITAVLWLVAFVIAESIPVFDDLLALISSIFASWFTYGFAGAFWLNINRGRWTESKKKIFFTVLNFVIILMGCGMFGMGLYASGTAIASATGNSWSCADNSSS